MMKVIAKFLPLDPASALGQSFVTEHFANYPDPILVSRTQAMQSGQCYKNVAAVISKQGGTMVVGYALVWWPKHFIEGLHHAIWQRPDGALEDVTGPAYPGMERTTHCWFIPDPVNIPTTEMAVPSRFRLLLGNLKAKSFINAALERTSAYEQALANRGSREHQLRAIEAAKYHQATWDNLRFANR